MAEADHQLAEVAEEEVVLQEAEVDLEDAVAEGVSGVPSDVC